LALDLSAVIILLTGLALGLAHSLDPDHIVAVSTLLCNTRSLRKSITSATFWGIGHSAVLFLAGLLVLILRVTIPDNVVNIFEAAAGVMLIVLGVYVIIPFIADRAQPSSPSAITEKRRWYDHPHDHNPANSDGGHSHIHKSAVTGILQGLGGSAALMLVTLTTVSSVELGLVFILIFGIGVILGMVGVSCLVGSILAYTASHLEKANRILKAVTGSVSIIVGIFIIIYALV